MLRILEKIALVLMAVLACSGMVRGQFTDDFSDPDIGNRWAGQVANFTVTSAGELRLNAPGAGNSYISRPYVVADSMRWEAYVRLEFAPSGSNRMRLWLLSDNAELDTGDGYYLEVGESGNSDALRLFKKTGNQRTEIANGTVGAMTDANAIARIQVSLDGDKNWSLSADYSGNSIFNLEFITPDDDFDFYGQEVYFGVHCFYTATRVDLFYFDDIRVDELEPDTIPPLLTGVDVVSNRLVRLSFNKALSTASLDENNFSLSPDAGDVSVDFFEDNSSVLELNFASSFTSQQTYDLSITGVRDLSSNVIRDTSVQFTFYIFETPDPYDVIFTELMARPSPPLGLPAEEYYELYNRSDKVIHLEDLQLLDGSTVRLFDNAILLPDEFIIVCSRANRPLFESFGKVATMVSFPSITISGKAFVLQNRMGNTIDYVKYDETFYRDNVKRNGGYALELINPETPCRLKDNWIGSDDVRGGTPGKVNSVWAPEQETTSPQMLNAYPTEDNEIKLTFSRKMDPITTGMQDAFMFSPALTIEQSRINPTNPLEVTVTTSEPLSRGVTYTITAEAVDDCLGFPYPTELDIIVGLPEEAEPLDLIINEVLFQPETGGSRFVEVYNRSDKILDAYPLILADFTGNTPAGFRTEQEQLIFPGQYVAFTGNVPYIMERYNPPLPVTILEARIPTLNDREGNITVYTVDAEGSVIIDELDYSRDFHYALLRDRRGVSIERINPERPTQDANNWHSAAENVGYATPGYVNSQFRLPETMSDDRVFFEDKFFSPNGDGDRDFLQINYELDRPGYVANVRVFDAEGRMVRDLVKGELLPSSGQILWDGTNQTGMVSRMGIYIVLAELVEPNGDVIIFKQDCVLGGL